LAGRLGKTIFAMQCLVHGARHCGEPGIFVAFEEKPRTHGCQLHSSAGTWAPAASAAGLRGRPPPPDLVQSGTFDLGWHAGALEAQARRMGARRIVFDALDIVLALLPDAGARRREVYRLHGWLNACGFTALITARPTANLPMAWAVSPSASCSSWSIAPWC
jgi:circadian clock protein KaiC